MRCIVSADTVFLQHFVAVLRKKTESKCLQKYVAILPDTDGPFLGKAETDQVRQILSAFTAVQIYISGNARVA